MGSKTGNKYISIGKFSPDEVLPYVVFGDVTHKLRQKGIKRSDDQWKAVCQKEYCGVMVNMTSMRYRTFATKGLKCVQCGLEGSYFSLESHIYKSGNRYYHFNLYAIDKVGDPVLMTKDHIIPKSLGGRNDLNNLQPMCVLCNQRKGHKINDQKRVRSFTDLFAEVIRSFQRSEEGRITTELHSKGLSGHEAASALREMERSVKRWEKQLNRHMNK